MRIFFDTEFSDVKDDGPHLLSIGLVRDDTFEYYAEVEGWEDILEQTQDKWVAENVVPHFRGGKFAKPRAVIAEEIRQFVGPKPEFWAYFADWDWVLLCKLYGRMLDVPQGWPHLCLDIKQLQLMLGVKSLPPQSESTEHDALADAKWNRKAFWELTSGRLK